MAATLALPIAQHLRDQALETPNAAAMKFEGRFTTYGEMDRHADQIANGLAALGLCPGERVAYLAKNSDLFFELFFGAARAGVVVAPLNWRLAAPELIAVINDSGAKVLFVGPEFNAVIRQIAPELTTIAETFAMEGGGEGWTAFTPWRDRQSDAQHGHPASVDDVALQLYTSGTTGLPKGAMLTHGSLLAVHRPTHGPMPDWNAWRPDDAALVAMPIFHVAGCGSGLNGLTSGSGALVVILREFNPDRVVEELEAKALSKMFLVPAALLALVNHPKIRDLDYSRLRYVYYGASPMPLDLIRQSAEIFPAGIVQLYGLTEVSGYVVALDDQDHASGSEERLRSAGRALRGVELVVTQADGSIAPPNEVGEILIRTGATMAGYWKQPGVSAATVDAEGWLHTGDAGYLDEEGYLFIKDRVKDMIITGGENVYPAEVESAIFGCPGVADVAVIGVPDKRWGEAVKAVIVPAPGARPKADDILAWARSRIAGYKLPKSIDFVDAMPRNGSGKILKRVLREPYWRSIDRNVN